MKCKENILKENQDATLSKRNLIKEHVNQIDQITVVNK